MAGDAGAAFVGTDQGGEDAHGGGLAGAVGAEHAQHAAGARGQVDPIQRLRVSEALLEPFSFDHVIHGRSIGNGPRSTLVARSQAL